jgi:hypothetical protein
MMEELRIPAGRRHLQYLVAFLEANRDLEIISS